LELASLGLALAYLGRHEEAVHVGKRVLGEPVIAQDAMTNPYYQHQLVRIYILAGQHEKAVELLELLLEVPYYLSPGWLRIDPNFDPLRGNPRFEALTRERSDRGSPP